jgi:hypothetical protein
LVVHGDLGQSVGGQKKALLFVNKKQQKKSVYLRALAALLPAPSVSESFFLIFLKKEALSSPAFGGFA